MTAKTYAPRTRQLAADVILQAAVDEAVALLRPSRTPYEKRLWRAERRLRAEATLLAAVTSADLLLGTP